MIFGAGEFLVAQCRRRGIYMYVDTNDVVMYWPPRLMPPELLRLVNARYYAIKQYLILEAVTGYGEDNGRQESSGRKAA